MSKSDKFHTSNSAERRFFSQSDTKNDSVPQRAFRTFPKLDGISESWPKGEIAQTLEKNSETSILSITQPDKTRVAQTQFFDLPPFWVSLSVIVFLFCLAPFYFILFALFLFLMLSSFLFVVVFFSLFLLL